MDMSSAKIDTHKSCLATLVLIALIAYRHKGSKLCGSLVISNIYVLHTLRVLQHKGSRHSGLGCWTLLEKLCRHRFFHSLKGTRFRVCLVSV
jgi:hypothetical protein